MMPPLRAALSRLATRAASSSSTSTPPPPPPNGLAAAAANTSSSSSSSGSGPAELKPLKLSYSCLEDRRKDVERKGAIVIHHSLVRGFDGVFSITMNLSFSFQLGCRKNWSKVAKEIHHLTHRKVVTPDARNHGESPHSRDMTYSLLAKDMQFLIKVRK